MLHSAKYAVEALSHSVTHDVPTGVANRELLTGCQCMAWPSADRPSMGLLNMDMDGLKSIHDWFGHRAGDVAIREFASHLGRITRVSDTVANIWGDVLAPFVFGGEALSIDASIGAALFPEDAREMDKLVEAADKQAKELDSPRQGIGGEAR